MHPIFTNFFQIFEKSWVWELRKLTGIRVWEVSTWILPSLPNIGSPVLFLFTMSSALPWSAVITYIPPTCSIASTIIWNWTSFHHQATKTNGLLTEQPRITDKLVAKNFINYNYETQNSKREIWNPNSLRQLILIWSFGL